jgi:beta-galactosidase/beta-glucuronidase
MLPVSTIHVDIVVEWDVGELTGGPANSDDAREHSRDWLVCVSLYEEGTMVSASTTTDGTTLYHFSCSSAHPIVQGKTWVPVPQPADQSGHVSVTLTTALKVTSPKQWSADSPHLYTLVMSLSDGYDESTIQAESCRVGFRTIELHKGLLRINGKPTIIRGVNVHEHHPLDGHTINAVTAETDVRFDYIQISVSNS